MGTVTKIALDQNKNNTCVVYLKFDDSQAVVKALEVQITMLEKTVLYTYSTSISQNYSQIRKTIFTRITKTTISYDTSMNKYSTQSTRTDIE